MFDEMVEEMAALFRGGVFSERTVFLFKVDGETVTVSIDPANFSVVKGAPAAAADCSCTMSSQMFKKIWYDGYRPGIMEFMTGAIKADNPLLLPQFLRSFGK